MSNDTISDMLTQIRNAIAVKHRFVIIPKTRMTLAITKVLEKEGYILSHEEFKHKFVNENGDKTNYLNTTWPIIAIGLKYSDTGRNRKSVITTLKRVSKPGLRVYAGSNDLPNILGNFGIAIVSTSKGVMTNIQAKKLGVGGEILCYVW
jgi:small subunit ribosomal protein S8